MSATAVADTAADDSAVSSAEPPPPPPPIPAAGGTRRSPDALPNALEHAAAIAAAAVAARPSVPHPPCSSSAGGDHGADVAEAPPPGPRRLVFFLDYDGTLSPIVPDPDAALLPDETRTALEGLARRHTTAIVTGRGLDKVRKLVALEQLIYAGSHGFDIDGPKGTVLAHTVGAEFRPLLATAAARVREHVLPKFPGSTLEDNTYALSVHYRNLLAADTLNVAELNEAVNKIASDIGLKRTQGKMVFEIRPQLNWNKGKAVEYLLDALQMAGPDVLPIYVGDDITDEDAFEALSRRGGISIIVADAGAGRTTAADFRLSDTKEVRDFLTYFGSSAVDA